MTDGERLAVLETQVSQLKWLLGLASAGILALFGVSNFVLIPRGAKAEVDSQLPAAVSAAVDEAMKTVAPDVEAKLRETAARVSAIEVDAKGTGSRISALLSTATATSAEIEKLRTQHARLPEDVRILAATTWSWMRPADEALAKAANKDDIAGVESMRNLLGARENELAEAFGFDLKTPLDTRP